MKWLATKRQIKKILKKFFRPLIKYKKMKEKITTDYLQNIKTIITEINQTKNQSIFLYNPKFINNLEHNCSDVKNIPCSEIYRDRDIKKITIAILKSNVSQIIFSSLYFGWEKLANQIKIVNPTIKIKLILYESEDKDNVFKIIELNNSLSYMYNRKLINVIGVMKENQFNFYKSLGIKTVLLDDVIPPENKKHIRKEATIGIYFFDKNNWYENLFTLMSAASLIPNITVDIYPLDSEIIEVAKIIGLNVTGENNILKSAEIKEKLSQNILNIYVPFLNYNRKLPIQSFAEGVPCIIGKSIDYFKNSPFADYIYIKNENNPEEIADKIKICIKKRKEIIENYRKWNKKNILEKEKSFKRFLKM